MPVPEGQYQLTFKIYDEASNLQWTEAQNQVHIGGGLFHVILGGVTPLDLPFDRPYLLGIQVGSDPELMPRLVLTSAAYSFRAAEANNVSGMNNVFPSDGNVGIGTTNPEQKLHVNGVARFAFPTGQIDISTPGGWPGFIALTQQGHRRDIIFDDPDAGSGYKGGIRLLTSTSSSAAPATNGITIDESGSVGIGTNLPAEKLTVAGVVQSMSGGFRFPDGTLQATAATGGNSSGWTRDAGNGEVELSNIGDKVGIGTASPQQKLHVVGLARFDLPTGEIDVSTPGGWPGLITFSPNGHRRDVIVWDSGIRIETSTSSAAPAAGNGITVSEGGELGIGTTVPLAKLDIHFGATGALRAGTPLGEGPGWIFIAPNGNRRDLNVANAGMVFRVGATSGAPRIRMVIGEGGNIGIGMDNVPSNILAVVQNSATDPIADAWTTYSSRRWKTNIQPIEGALEKVQKLQGVTYDWKKGGKHDLGLIAEDVGKVIPEVVAYESNGVDTKSVDYARLVAVLIEAVKEQQKQIEALQAALGSLDAE